MQSERMNVIPLGQNVWLLDDNHESACYVVCGTERALVVDTVNGEEDLQAIVREITDLPLVVVNTHGHCDHVYGNVYFDEAWIHPDDLPILKAHFSRAHGERADMKRECCALRFLEIGQIIDLGGGNEVEVISLRGHTPGSIGLLDRRRRVLFSGDGMNPHIWMQLHESTSIRELHETLVHVREAYGKDFDFVGFGHATAGYLDAGILKLLIEGCEQMLRGETAQDEDYHWFGGVCRQHSYHGVPGDVIVYTQDKL